jgi:ABC-type glycerol-3-phosphate transport system substrate-binding protein
MRKSLFSILPKNLPTKKQISRRRFLGVASGGAALTIGGLLAAREISKLMTPDQVEVWMNSNSVLRCTQLDAAFVSSQTRMKLSKTKCWTSVAEMGKAFLGKLAIGQVPDLVVHGIAPIELAARGWAEPLDDLMRSSTYSNLDQWRYDSLDTSRYQDKHYALPISASPIAVFYNQEAFQRLGIKTDRDHFPKTWKELRNLSKEITFWNKGKLQTAGMTPWCDPDHLHVWFSANGGGFFDVQGQKYTIDSEANIESMRFLLDWLNEEYRGDLDTIQDSEFDWNDDGRPPRAFLEGRQAIMAAGSSLAGELYGEYASQRKFDEWDLAPHPVGPNGAASVSGYYVTWVSIPKQSHHIAEAFQHLDYLAGVGAQAWCQSTLEMPMNRHVSQDVVPDFLLAQRGRAFVDDITSFLRERMAVSVPMWRSPVALEQFSIIDDVVTRIYRKQVTPEQGLREAQQACQSTFDKARPK